MLKKNNKDNKQKIGEALVSKKLISKKDLLEALKIQKNYGSKIGKVLIGEGKIRAYQFYQALAQQLGKEFVNLEESPCEEILLEASERENYLRFHAIPWKKEDKTIILAVSEISPEMEYWAQNKYGNVRFVITSNFDIFKAVQKRFHAEDDEDAREKLWKESPDQSAKFLFNTMRGRNIMIVLAVLFFAAFFVTSFLKIFFIAVNIFYLITLIFKSIFFFSGVFSKQKPFNKSALDSSSLPVYSLLIPVYKEKKETIENLLQAIRDLDYPKALLDVKLIAEEDDLETIENIKYFQPESYFEIIRVPYSEPRTKPKACNYALRFAHGEYVTIYDAEDRPDPMQLKKALAKFNESPDDLICVQSKLNYYNRTENALTRMFSFEYSSWFNFMLLGLEALKIPIPLGGTSNHFNINKLRELNAWDPYNVTEDADLGIRLAQEGYKTAIIDSTTLEEAPITISAWITQRSRWIKGYIQTYIVHSRSAFKITKYFGLRGLLGFIFFVGAPSLVFITMPIIITLALVSFLSGITYPDWFFIIAMMNLIGGVSVHMLIAVFVVRKEKWKGMLPYSLLFPFYWILHSVSSFKALWQLVTRPHYWEKTEHGVSKMSKNKGL